MVVTAAVAVAYKALNKAPAPKAPLISDDIAQQLIQMQTDQNTGPVYTNVLSIHMGYDPTTIFQTSTLSGPTDCINLCNGIGAKCTGFQVRSDGRTCDFLNSNVSKTYGFTETGWNYYQLDRFTPQKAFDAAITGQGGGGAKIGTITGANTKDKCAPYCKSNTECIAMSVNSTGCDLWKTGYSQYASPGTDLYKLKTVQYAQVQ